MVCGRACKGGASQVAWPKNNGRAHPTSDA